MVFKNSANDSLINKESDVEMSMCFYVPKVNQENTPVPNNLNLTVFTAGVVDVAAIRFGGWAYTSDWLR